jgi:GTP-binding protein
MMKIKSAEHEITAVGPSQYPGENLPEVAFAGRSNVGKSSMINSLLNRRNLAYVGSTPGKTRQLNFFIINDEFRFVDLPGYGYAKVSKAERHSWGKLANTYLEKREQLKLIVHLIDIRHKPTVQDKEMSRWLSHSGIPYAVCAVKSDKIARGKYRRHASTIISELDLHPDTPFVIYSSEKKEGVSELWEIIEYFLFDEGENEESAEAGEGTME